jgi:hypothetical protein
MRRKLLSLCSAVSLVLCVAVCLETFGTLATTSDRFRDQNGLWPNSPRELKPLLKDPAIDVERIDQTVSFRITSRGLAFVNRESNETAIVVANESTKYHLVLTGEVRPPPR